MYIFALNLKNKQMKKLILGAALTLFACTTNAQIKKGFYAGVSAGYNFCSNANSNLQYGEFVTFYNGTDSPTGVNFETVKLSLGKGVNVGGNFGYMFNKNIGAEMGIGLLLGSETTSTRTDIDSFGLNSQNNSIKTNQLQIKPAFVIAAGYEKINPYAKIGLVMGMGKTTYTNTEFDASTGDTFDMEAELTGGMMLAFRGSAGINFSINSKLALFAELTSISGNISPTEAEITKANVNGVSQLAFMTYNDSHVEFVDSHTFGGPESDNEAHKSPRPSFNASSLGLNFGVSYHF